MRRGLVCSGVAVTAGVVVAGVQTAWDLAGYLAANPLPSGVTLLQTLRFFSAPLGHAAAAVPALALPGLVVALLRRRSPFFLPALAAVSGGLLVMALAAAAAGPPVTPTLRQLGCAAALAAACSLGWLAASRGREGSRRPGGLRTLAAALPGPLLLALWLLPETSGALRRWLRPEAATGAPNLLLVVLDTARADGLSIYGGPAGNTPHIDRAGARGEVYLGAVATSAWTLPSHASIFTGLLPSGHGATYATWRLAGGLDTLAGSLGRLGYDTAGWSANPLVSRATGLDRGFDHFRELWRSDWTGPFLLERLHAGARTLAGRPPVPPAEPDAVRETTEALDWISRRQRPWLVFINYFEPHGSYDPPEPFRSRALATLELSREEHRQVDRLVGESGLADLPLRYLAGRLSWSPRELEILRALYHAEIAFTDSQVGRLLAAVESDGGEGRRTLVVITADHGEHFGEHGRVAHHFSLHQELIRVPLIIRDPRRPETGRLDREDVVSLALLHRYLLDAGRGALWPPGGLGGEDGHRAGTAVAELDPPEALVERFTAGDPTGDREVFHRSFWAALGGRWKLLWSPPGDPALFDLEDDPEERQNRAAEEPERLREAIRQLQRAGSFEPRAGGEGGALDPEARRRLEALGYL